MIVNYSGNLEAAVKLIGPSKNSPRLPDLVNLISEMTPANYVSFRAVMPTPRYLNSETTAFDAEPVVSIKAYNGMVGFAVPKKSLPRNKRSRAVLEHLVRLLLSPLDEPVCVELKIRNLRDNDTLLGAPLHLEPGEYLYAELAEEKAGLRQLLPNAKYASIDFYDNKHGLGRPAVSCNFSFKGEPSLLTVSSGRSSYDRDALVKRLREEFPEVGVRY